MAFNLIDTLVSNYRGNGWSIHRLVDDLTHEESMLQPGFGANCLNWVLGHIVTRRNTALEVLGKEPVWSREITNLYRAARWR